MGAALKRKRKKKRQVFERLKEREKDARVAAERAKEGASGKRRRASGRAKAHRGADSSREQGEGPRPTHAVLTRALLFKGSWEPGRILSPGGHVRDLDLTRLCLASEL